jgi:hypothetical protein
MLLIRLIWSVPNNANEEINKVFCPPVGFIRERKPGLVMLREPRDRTGIELLVEGGSARTVHSRVVANASDKEKLLKATPMAKSNLQDF